MQFCFSSSEGSKKPSWDRRSAQQKGDHGKEQLLSPGCTPQSAGVSRGRVVVPTGLHCCTSPFPARQGSNSLLSVFPPPQSPFKCSHLAVDKLNSRVKFPAGFRTEMSSQRVLQMGESCLRVSAEMRQHLHPEWGTAPGNTWGTNRDPLIYCQKNLKLYLRFSQ